LRPLLRLSVRSGRPRVVFDGGNNRIERFTVDAAPTAVEQTLKLSASRTETVTLATSDTNATPTTGCATVGSPSNARLSVTISNIPTPCQATLTDSGHSPAIVTFQFNATDGVSTGNTVTDTVNIGPHGRSSR
jgi:hypothetical protein